MLGKAEETLPSLLKEIESEEVKVVVDPPRCGLHKYVKRALRKHQKLKDLVYVSCNPASLAEDLLYFIRPQNTKREGRPFSVVKAAVVDMFPHTEHCEMVVLLSRISENEDLCNTSVDGEKELEQS